MALSKEIELENGTKVSYHRIVDITKVVNRYVSLQIASYVNEEQRQKEIDFYPPDGESTIFCIYSEILNLPYDEDKTIQDYYDYLKTTDKYKDAIDV